MEKTKAKIFILAVILTFGFGSAYSQKQPQPIFPSAPFNKEETLNALKAGTSTLRGVVIKKAEDPVNTRLDVEVTLFPVTSYFTEFLELSKKYKKDKKKFATMTNEAFSYRIVTKVSDKDGTFEFKSLKPGKYYLITEVTSGKTGTGTQQIGTSTSTGYNVFGQAVSSTTSPIYQSYKFRYTVDSQFAVFADITAEGQIVDVKL